MEVSVLNIKGQDTGKKVTLNDSVFGVEPNDHAIYILLHNVKELQKQKNVANSLVLLASSAVKKVVVVHVVVTSTLHCS